MLGPRALPLVILGGVAAICFGGGITTLLSGGGILGLGALVLYGRDILHLYRARKRRTIEFNSRMAAVALANLARSRS